MAEWSKALVLGTSLQGGVGSNPTTANFATWLSVVLWCSGYHICLTRRRSPVRNRAAPFLAFFLIPISGFGKKKWREEEAKWAHQMRLQHVH